MNTILALQQFASPELDRLVYWLTNLGAEQTYIIMLVITYLGLSARAGRRLGIALLSSFYLNQVAKTLFDTPRPFESFPEIVRSEEARTTALGAAFPSGHAQGAATFWLLAAWYVKRLWFWAIAYLLVLVIGLSRLYLGVHYPVDVVGGTLLGVAILLLCVGAFRLADSARGANRLVLLAGVLVPLLLHLLFPTADSALILGALAAFLTGPLLYTHVVSGVWWKRVALSLLGIVLVFAVLLGSSVMLPEAYKRNPLVGFCRYLVIGYVGTVLAPWLGRVLRLSPRPPA